MKKRQKIMVMLMCMVLEGILLLNFTGCSVKIQAADLMQNVEANAVEGKPSDDAFLQACADFAVKLFKNSADPEKNSLISPLSVMLALAMTANGADTQTKTEMETLLGGTIPLEDLNGYLYTYVQQLPSEKKYKLEIANSIWFRNDEERLKVNREFLQKNADYYNAAAYQSDFNKQTLADINHWVKDKTDGMIDKIVDEIDPSTVMYLINALVFDAEWDRVYTKGEVINGDFTAQNGAVRSVKMMCSAETKYLRDENAIGFIKNYKDGKYSFAALLPNEKISVGDYIASLSGTRLLSMLSDAEDAHVTVRLPKFTYDYSVGMNDALKKMGMPTAFSGEKADFSKLGSASDGNIYIGDVLHKTFISVDELGTKAGAVTKVEMKVESAMPSGYNVTLDRPFVYAIIDNSTNLPIFLGAALDIGK